MRFTNVQDGKSNLETLGFTARDIAITRRAYTSERIRLDYARALMRTSGQNFAITYDPHTDTIAERAISGIVRLEPPELLICERPHIGEHARHIPHADLQDGNALRSVAATFELPDLEDLPILEYA